MDRNEWLGKLELLHARARGGEDLEPAERAWYREARDLLLRGAVERYNAWLAEGERARRAVRLERAVPVVLRDEAGATRRAVTVDFGAGGFAAILEQEPAPGTPFRALLALPDGDLSARVTASPAAARGEVHRVSFALDDDEKEARARLEDFLLDELLPKLLFWDEVLTRLRL
jgi:hypothetical protein